MTSARRNETPQPLLVRLKAVFARINTFDTIIATSGKAVKTVSYTGNGYFLDPSTQRKPKSLKSTFVGTL